MAADGTGGHIYPSVAIAEELKIMKPLVKLFIGAPNSMESIVVPCAGYNFAYVPTIGFACPLIAPQNLFLLCYLVKSLVQCSRKLRDFKPHVIIGISGLVSFSIYLATELKGIKLVIQEQNFERHNNQL